MMKISYSKNNKNSNHSFLINTTYFNLFMTKTHNLIITNDKTRVVVSNNSKYCYKLNGFLSKKR